MHDVGWLEAILTSLAAARPVFHSEADFQHALAWELHRRHPEAVIRLEVRPDPELREAVDLRLVVGGVEIFVELKYLVRSLDLEISGERFVLRNQGAQPISRYDVLKDIARLERFCISGARGFAVVLSNDPMVWSAGGSGTIDYAFRIHEGAELSGTMAWAPHTGAGTSRGRDVPIVLRGAYPVAWRPWPANIPDEHGQFRFLVIEVC